jgi:predicted nuclease with TOPRIM domain
MINEIINRMIKVINTLNELMDNDLEDIKKANNDSLLDRNSEKQAKMDELVSLKERLNEELIKEIQAGKDVDKYREIVDQLEESLKSLYEKNKKLAAVVLPLKEMYKEIVEDISDNNKGVLFDIKA